MVVIHKGRLKRKESGGKYKSARAKRNFEKGSPPTKTGVGKHKIKTVRTRGGNIKSRVLRAEKVNLFNPKTKKFESAKVKTVVETPANRHYVRRNIFTKGAIIETEKGKARVTSRPGQNGSVNAVLI
ncbi:30S ribosomal protein S8e [Candidatus Woesearchaeota archaeon]|nr:30S ribosomal protein S8e [Candidatus Woesearchaeota archaeon]